MMTFDQRHPLITDRISPDEVRKLLEEEREAHRETVRLLSDLLAGRFYCGDMGPIEAARTHLARPDVAARLTPAPPADTRQD